jgi:RNA polymerase sigma factor (sigma-70 family)
MTTLDDGALLAKYVQENSEEAFRTLMFRYANLVFGVCKRTLRDAELAEDATQSVFLLLAKNAQKLTGRYTIAGWLHTSSIRVSRTLARKEGTRKTYEKMATPIDCTEDPFEEALKLVVDAGLAKLKAQEREAILLRFFQEASYPEIGHQLNIGEDAARMRVNRALEQLRQNFAKAGLVLSPAELSSVLQRAVETAPATLLQKLGALSNLGKAPPLAHLTPTKGISRIIMLSSPIIVCIVALVAFSSSGAHTPKVAVASRVKAASIVAPKQAIDPAVSTQSDKERKVDAKESLNALIAEFPGNWTWISYTDDKAHPVSKDAAVVTYNQAKQVFEIRATGPGEGTFADWKPNPDDGTLQRFAAEKEPVYEHFVSGTEKQGLYSLVFSAKSGIAKYLTTVKFDKNHFEFLTKTTEVTASPEVSITMAFERPGP